MYAREEFEQHLPECRNTVKRLSTLHAVTISTPIKFKIVSVKNDNEKSTQGTEVDYSKIVYTIDIVNKQKTNIVEKDL